jgi:hypothetical protein
VALAVHKKTAKMFWEMESADTKAEIRASIETMYDVEQMEWEEIQEVYKTSQEYHSKLDHLIITKCGNLLLCLSQLQTVGQHLQLIVEAITSLMKVPVVIMMLVLIPEKNGDIECLR